MSGQILFTDKLFVLPGGTLEGLDQRSNLDANSSYGYKTVDVSACKGQTLTIRFSASTDGSNPTLFRIDDVSIIVSVPVQPTPMLFGVGGPTSVPEGGTAQYSAIVVYSDGSIVPVAPSWSVSGPASITSSGFLSAGTVNGDTAATVTANYTGFNALNYSITILHVAPVFSFLAISGTTSMNGNSSAQFAGTAVFSDGTSQSVSPIWSIASGPGSISSSGLLTVGQVNANTTTTVSATYTIGSITRSASDQVSIVHVAPTTTFTSLSITGPSSLNENSTAQYSATAWFSDGSSQLVNATWSVDSSVTSVSTYGVLSAGTVTASTPVNVSASITIGGITHTATQAVNVSVVSVTVLPRAGSNGSISQNVPESVNLGASCAFIATPNNGYSVAQWLFNDVPMQNGSTNFVLTNVMFAGTVEVTFTNAWLSTGFLQVNIHPPGVVSAGAEWQIGGAGWQTSGTTVGGLSVGNYTVSFRAVTGWTTPSNQDVAVSANVVTTVTGTYVSNSPPAHKFYLVAWGNNDYQQTNVPADLPPISRIACGSYHGLALGVDGTAVGWGRNDFREINVPLDLTNAVALAAGQVHSVALNADGTVVAWGDDTFGQTDVPMALRNVVAIAAYHDHSLALKADGSVVAWGWNKYGQTNVPTVLTNAVAIAAGQFHSLALKSDGTVLAWGDDTYGQLNVPPTLSHVVSICGGSAHNLALRSDGTVVGWADNHSGQASPPDGLTNVVAIATGFNHSLALRSDGTLVGWGDNSYNQISLAASLTNVNYIAAGGNFSVALFGATQPVVPPKMFKPALSNNIVAISVSTIRGAAYMLEFNNSLQDANWTMRPPTPGDDTVKSIIDPSGRAEERFYRLRVD